MIDVVALLLFLIVEMWERDSLGKKQRFLQHFEKPSNACSCRYSIKFVNMTTTSNGNEGGGNKTYLSGADDE